MGLFEKVFGTFKRNDNRYTRYEMIADSNNGFFSFRGSIYKSDIVRSCIRPKSLAVGKLIAKHIRDNKQGFKINPDNRIRFLLEEPNALMSGQVLQEKVTTQLELNNNAFIYVKFDADGYAYELWPVPCNSVEVVQSDSNAIFLKFTFSNGKVQQIPYEHIIHLRKDFNENDFFGDDPKQALLPLMEVINTTDQGIVSAVKNSAVIKWIMKFGSVLKKEDVEKQVRDFTTQYLNIENSGGAAASDPRYDLQQVKQDNYVPPSTVMTNTILRIYSFFNTNEKIVQSKFNEDEWNAYYESQIEPLAMQLSNEYTRKIFTRNERGHGNQIIFEASSLQYASMQTKLNLVQMVDRRSLTPNEWRKVMNLGPIEGGDEAIMRLDTAVVDGTSKGGEENGKNGKKKADE
ncbi:MAG: phage portal protein [Bacilli bacterium]